MIPTLNPVVVVVGVVVVVVVVVVVAAAAAVGVLGGGGVVVLVMMDIMPGVFPNLSTWGGDGSEFKNDTEIVINDLSFESCLHLW
jgi:hypothetical protein